MRMTYWKNKIVMIIMLILVLLPAGCFSGRYGNIIIDSPTTRDFDTFKIDQGMNYYYSGPDLYPNALIGLKRQYSLGPDLWKPIKPTPESFRDIILHMQEKAREYGQLQHGFLMQDDHGKPVGIWYSILKAKTFVKMGEGNKVIVFTPDLMIYEETPGGPSVSHDGK